MKYFKVEQEYISAHTKVAEVYRDGELIDDDDITHEKKQYRHIILAYWVKEYDEDGMLITERIYSVKTNELGQTDSDRVLALIESDHPAGEWQNDNW